MNSPDSCDSSGAQLRARAGGRAQNWFKSSRKERSECQSEFRVFAGQCGRERSRRIWGCSSGSSTSPLPKATVSLHVPRAASWALRAWDTGRRVNPISPRVGEFGYEQRNWWGKVSGEMRKWIPEFTSSKHSWGIISEEQQWRPCLCPAPADSFWDFLSM